MPDSVRRSFALAALTGVLVLADAGFAALSLLVWSLHRQGNVETVEAATFALAGISAVLGAIVLLLALTALARGRPATARVAVSIAWLRALAVVVAVCVIAVALGVSAVAGMLQTTGVFIALFDASLGVFVAGTALRRTVR
jgi:hypothetical protein